jgi:acetate kinase
MPPTAPARILTVNGGSSSVKFALYHPGAPPQRLALGSVERIGHPAGPADFGAAATHVVDWVRDQLGGAAPTAIGQRIVHGGPHYCEPVRITPAVLADLRQLSAYDPEHLPAELELVEQLQQRWPEVPQLACFDTAFHHDLPRVAQLLPLPRRYFEQGVRRYGFHGLSYQFLLEELARTAGSAAADGRIILAHLGHGASLAAVHHGRPVDTTMAFTPASGLPMGTRSGDLDPGLVQYLALTEGRDAAGWNRLVHHEAGLRGLSETSSDMRDLLARAAADQRAADAVAVFCYQLRKWIGAYAAALSGLETLVFAGGIGEHAAPVRAAACSGLEFLGIELDAAQNSLNAGIISRGGARVTVRVLHTDEERVLASAVGDWLTRTGAKQEGAHAGNDTQR